MGIYGYNSEKIFVRARLLSLARYNIDRDIDHHSMIIF